MSNGGTETGAGVEAVVMVDIEFWADAPVSSLPLLLLLVVLELALTFPGDGADSARSTSDEISRMAVGAGFTASSCIVGRVGDPKILR